MRNSIVVGLVGVLLGICLLRCSIVVRWWWLVGCCWGMGRYWGCFGLRVDMFGLVLVTLWCCSYWMNFVDDDRIILTSNHVSHISHSVGVNLDLANLFISQTNDHYTSHPPNHNSYDNS